MCCCFTFLPFGWIKMHTRKILVEILQLRFDFFSAFSYSFWFFLCLLPSPWLCPLRSISLMMRCVCSCKSRFFWIKKNLTRVQLAVLRKVKQGAFLLSTSCMNVVSFEWRLEGFHVKHSPKCLQKVFIDDKPAVAARQTKARNIFAFTREREPKYFNGGLAIESSRINQED